MDYIIFKHKPKLSNIKTITKDIAICRPVASNNLKIVKDYVIQKIKSIGLQIEMQSFTKIINNNSYDFSNIIAYYPNYSKYTILSAHIDSILNCDGAIDSATSIAIILEIMRILPPNNFMIVFFDGEEAVGGPWSLDNTLIGSKYFVDNYNLNKINMVYLLDLIGGNTPIYAFNHNSNTHHIIKSLHSLNSPYSTKIFIDPNIETSPKVISDDNMPFIEKNIPNINLIPNNFPPQHHKSTDTYHNINWDYVNTFTKIFHQHISIKI